MLSDVLVLAPHVDDEAIGCGGTIARITESHVTVHVAAFSTAEISLPEGYDEGDIKAEFFNSCQALGALGSIFNYETRRLHEARQDILDTMIWLRERWDPDLVICPSLKDAHQDHKVIAEEAARAFWKTNILAFESVRKCKEFYPKVWISLTEEQLYKKLQAIECYHSQSEKPFFPGCNGSVVGLAKVRGFQCGQQYAEAFECVQMVL